MHGFRSGSAILLNAEVDSMGGVIDGGVGIASKTSPRRAAIEKAQAELRLEYDVREERRRELEFLEKGGNPLDFKFGHVASLSVQSTSLPECLADQLFSEVKGSYALPNSPHGDSVESSGRLGMAVDWELNSADNFDGDNQLRESETKSEQLKSIITPLEHSSEHDGHQNAEELEDSPIFHPKRSQAYRRRNRSWATRDVARSSSTDVVSRGGQDSFIFGRNIADFKAIDPEKKMNLELVGAVAVDSSCNSVKVCLLDEKSAPSANIYVTDHPYTGNLKDNRSSLGVASEEPDCAIGSDLAIPVGITCHPTGVEKLENHNSHGELNDSSKTKGEEKCNKYNAVMDTAGCTLKGLDSESSCTQTSLSIDGNGIVDSKLCDLRHVDSDGASKGENLASDKMPNGKDDKIFVGKHASDSVERCFCTNDDQNSVVPIDQSNGFADKDENGNRFSLQNESSCSSHIQEIESAGLADPESHTKDASDGPNPGLKSSSHEKVQGSRDSWDIEVTPTVVPGPRHTPELPTPCENQLKAGDKAQEDRILAEARIIEAKRKRFVELSGCALPSVFYKKSHWDFVLEEMAWLANDFAQERLWKVTAAAQLCREAALACCLRSEENNKHGKLRTIARTLANAVMEFWHLAESSLQVDGLSSCLQSSKYDADAFQKIVDFGLVKGRIRCPDEEVDETTEMEPKICRKDLLHPVQGYAVRFLQCNNSATPIVRDDTFSDLPSDVTVPDLLWQDNLTEENLFYMVPPGSIESYRKSIESYLVCSEKDNKHKDDAGTSMYDATAEFGSQENDAEENGESVYYFPGRYEGGRSLKIVHRKRNNIKSYAARSREFGGYGNITGNMVGPAQSGLVGKRSINSLNVGPIPTKRMRTASRQRVLGPSVGVAVGGVSTPTRTGASSGDTNSLPDDHNMQHGGFTTQKVSEVESRMAFDSQSILDPAEVPLKPKKKKKAKHQATTYDQKWAFESVQNEQRDHFKKRSDANHYESNGTSGIFVHQAKKSKLMKQLDNSFGNVIPMSGTVASPVGSQMSNMSNANKLTKFIIGRDQGRKARLSKGSVHQPGCGSEWTLYEDQALVVLVHDMGPNWELVSDAFNSTLLFKGAFRRPSECKERHKDLMDRHSGDGTDSVEDSGSSQTYKSTLPGIPKGSARQLFQQLQEPLEEDTIKSHFEKIALLGSRFPNRNKLNDSRDLKQIATIHGSHFSSLSQVFPNNLNGAVLTPLDLCDASASSPDVFPLVCQPPASLGSPNQGVIPSMLSPGGNVSLQNSPGMGIHSNLMTPAHTNASIRDGRYNVHKMGNMPIDEQQRVQKHSRMMLNRNVHPPNKLVPPGALSLPGGPSQGKSILGPRDNMHMPNQIAEHQRQMMLSEIQLQATQGSTQGVPPFGGLSSPFPKQSVSSPVQTFPVHHQQQHQVPRHLNALTNPHHPLLQGGTHPSAEQQAYLRAARQQQQRMLHRQQQRMLHRQQQRQQYPTSNALMAHVQTQPHLPTSSPVQNNSQMQSPAFSQEVPLPALTPSSPMTPTSHQQQKHLLPPHGLGRSSQSNTGGGMNQIAKQHGQSTELQHQQFQQSDRHNLHQGLQSQSIQQAKRLNGVGRGTMLMHKNLPHDTSQPNGLSGNQVSQAIEKGEQAMHLTQGHEMSSGSKHLVLRQPSGQLKQQQKPLSSSAPISAQQVQQMILHHEDSNISQVKVIPSSAVGVPASTQGLQTSAMPPHNQKLQASVKFINQSQAAIQRSIQQNRQANSNLMENSRSEQSQEEQLMNNSLLLEVAPGTSTACIDPSNAVTIPSQIGSTGSPHNSFSS